MKPISTREGVSCIIPALNEEEYKTFFIEKGTLRMDESDIKKVVRPRTSPLFHSYKTPKGEIKVWTTFSEDQVDINYRSIEALHKMIDTLLLYLSHGISMIRLDAIPFLWKEKGTNCSHHKKTHLLVQLYKNICHLVDPNIVLITESNVPHQENISYFGSPEDKFPEADMIYNFSLAPLLLQTLITQDSSIFSQWLKSIVLPKNKYFFNFLATHDGIGLRGAEGLLEKKDLQNMKNLCEDNQGKVSYKVARSGKKKIYELNSTWASIMHDKEISEEMNTEKILLSYSILLSLQGIPAMYYNCLIGQKNQHDEVKDTLPETFRRINRSPLDGENFESLPGYESIFLPLQKIIQLKQNIVAFAPQSSQKVYVENKNIIVFERYKTEEEKILVIANISKQPISFSLPKHWENKPLMNLLANKIIKITDNTVLLDPYDILWLEEEKI